jgi:hypothetical protein
MNIKQLATMVETHIPDDYKFWAGGHINQYALSKDTSSTFAMVLPDYPLFWRDGQCKLPITLQFYVLQAVGLKNVQGESQQHLPYNGLDLIVTVHACITEFIRSIAQDDNFKALTPSDVQFFPAVEGMTVNAQAVAKFTLKGMMYFKASDIFDYQLNFNIQ